MDIDIEKQVEYINLELKKNSKATVNKLCDKIGIKQSTFKSKVHKAGYKFDFHNRAYVKEKVVNDNNRTNVINPKMIEENKSNDNDMTLVITDKVIKNNLINLAQNYDKIMNFINKNDEQYDKRYDGIVIELPVETKLDYRTTIRVNNVVWDQFNKFAADHKEFTKKDLLSMALKKYIDKYNK